MPRRRHGALVKRAAEPPRSAPRPRRPPHARRRVRPLADRPGHPRRRQPGVRLEAHVRHRLYLPQAATLAPYEGLMVNFTEAAQSAGKPFLASHGATVSVDSSQALRALQFLVGGVKAGWIPREDLGFSSGADAQNELAGTRAG
jgi:hypothetical protein